MRCGARLVADHRLTAELLVGGADHRRAANPRHAAHGDVRMGVRVRVGAHERMVHIARAANEQRVSERDAISITWLPSAKPVLVERRGGVAMMLGPSKIEERPLRADPRRPCGAGQTSPEHDRGARGTCRVQRPRCPRGSQPCRPYLCALSRSSARPGGRTAANPGRWDVGMAARRPLPRTRRVGATESAHGVVHPLRPIESLRWPAPSITSRSVLRDRFWNWARCSAASEHPMTPDRESGDGTAM